MKVHDTRRQRATELLRLCTHGPSFSMIGRESYSPEIATSSYRLWASSWVVPLLHQLVPELREKKP